MKQNWFTEWGFIYYPTHIIGWVLSILAFIFCVHIFLVVDHHSHSVSDTLYGIFPYVVPTLLLLGWIAERTSK